MIFSKKPILSSAEKESYTAKLIEESCGWLVGDSSSWVNVFITTSNCSDDELVRLGNAGFEYAQKHFSKSVGLEKIESLIKRMV
jgi:hypothetical protein